MSTNTFPDLDQMSNPTSVVAEMIAKMVSTAPELASSYAKYHLKRDHWLGPSDTDQEGEPCFIAGEKGADKTDYVRIRQRTIR